MASIERRVTTAGDPRFVVRYRDVRRKSREKTFRSRVDAERFRLQVDARVQAGTWVDPGLARVLFGDRLVEWLDQQTGIKPKTRSTYESLAARVAKGLGEIRLGDLNRAAVSEWVRSMEAEGLSASRIRQAVGLARRCARDAVQEGLIPRDPFEAIKLPRLPTGAGRYLTPDEVERLAQEIGPEYSLLVRVLAYTGMRFGEAAGLAWGDVNYLKKRIEIRRSFTDVNGRVVESSPKNGRSRHVTMPARLFTELEERRGSETELVFTSAKGLPLRANNFRRRYFCPALSRAGLERVRIHDLRHTCAAWLIDRGATPELVKRQLGHQSINTTLTIYAHLMGDALEDNRATLEAVMRSTSER